MISLIAAMDKNFGIGHTNALPWPHIPADMKHFRETTKGKTVVMGRKTFESIGRPLPNRRNIIITRDANFRAEGCEIFHSTEEILPLAQTEEVFVIGGGVIFKELLPHADKLYLTFIDGEFPGDVKFPLQDFSGWEKASERIVEPGEETAYKLRFTEWVKK
ncbi:MAG: dihydrofolate reductase [Candidatus Liptonbacteria bacterium]|nr:dihydrofolate reductase [Candidatus Liptonbacteria bacterium]